MRGLLLKDFYVVKGQSKTYLALLAFFLVFTLTGVYDATFFSGFFVLLMTMLPVSTFSYDDLARWPKFAAATPAGRRGVVRSKYLLVLCTLCVSAVVLVALDLLYSAVRGPFARLPELLLAGGCCLAVGLILDLVLFPILFKYGPEKGRLIMLALFLAMFLLILGAGALFSKCGLSLPQPPGWLLISVLALGALAAGAVLSYSASLRIFGKKEL